VSVATNLAVANRGDVRYQIILIAINVVSLLFFCFHDIYKQYCHNLPYNPYIPKHYFYYVIYFIKINNI